MAWMKLKPTWYTFKEEEGGLMLSVCGMDGRDEDDAGWGVANNHAFPGIRAYGETREKALEAYADRCREEASTLLGMADTARRAIEQMAEEE